MHSALQFFPQRPHSTHLLWSITGFISDQRDTKPSSVPTGQMVLHQRRPRQSDKAATITSSAEAVTSVTADTAFTSTL